GDDMRSGGTLGLQKPNLNLQELQQLATEFVGAIQQTPPPFSAKKINGVPAYKLARKHQVVELKPVEVEIKEFAITSLENDRASFHARVSSGTYMRSVAHDLGQRLGCGAHLESLRRTSVAEFDIAQAHTLEEIETASNCLTVRHPDPINCHSDRSMSSPKAETCGPRVLPTSEIPGGSAHLAEEPAEENLRIEREPASMQSLFIHPRQLLPQFPCVTADEPTTARIRNGRPVNLPELSGARQVKVFASQTQLLAVATRVAGSLFHPKIVFLSER
ncbi:MAG: hypothetical protein WA824_18980, partial [Candidatus Sulfotelmatobacter sp.]